MLAELCVQTEGLNTERAWNIADAVYERPARYVADTDKGMLWRTIKKLMTKAQNVRRRHLGLVANGVVSSVSSSSGASAYPDPRTSGSYKQDLLFNRSAFETLPTWPYNATLSMFGIEPGPSTADPISMDWK